MRGVKVLQTATKQALPIYGTAYGTGTAQMKGKLPKLLLDVNLRSAPGTDVVLDFNKTDVRKDERLFTYRPLRPLSTQDSLAFADTVARPAVAAETEVTMRMALHLDFIQRLDEGEEVFAWMALAEVPDVHARQHDLASTFSGKST